MPEPKPGQFTTPHTCGGSCSRIRERVCGHACPLQLHPGPHPPRQVTMRLERYCPRKKILSFLCGPMGRESAKRNGILPARTPVDGRWGVVGNLVQRFATTILHVRCANPFDAGVGRRRRWGLVWWGRDSQLSCRRGESDREVWVRPLCQVS